MASVQVGDVLSGRYRIVGERGAGAMGTVFEAEDVHSRVRLAVKVLRPEVADIPNVAARLEREGRLVSQLSSPHVVRVFDVGRTPGGLPFVVMELLEGRDLGTELAERGALPVGEAVRWVRQACEALDQAHRAGMVHRDLKPSNLFLARTPEGPDLKVLDFGVSKELGGSAALTMTHAALGTPLYMSPEQVRSAASVDPRSDVWALGVVLFELVTGRTPHDGSSGPVVMASILADAPLTLRAARPDAPPELEAVVSAVLEKDPAKRIPSARALSEALRPFEPAVGIEAMPTMLGMPPEHPDLAPNPDLAARTELGGPPVAMAGAAAPRQLEGLASLSRNARIAIAAVAAVLVVGGAIGAFRRFGKHGPEAAAKGKATDVASFASLVSKQGERTASERTTAYRGCVLAKQGQGWTVGALVPSAEIPEPTEDLDAALSTTPKPRLALDVPWAKDEGAPEIVVRPITPLSNVLRSEPIPAIVVTDRAMFLGLVGDTVYEELGTEAARLRVKDKLAPDAAGWVVVAEGDAPLERVQRALELLANAHGTVVLAVPVPRTEGAPGQIASATPGMCQEAASYDVRAPDAAEQGAAVAKLGELQTACAAKLPWVSGTRLRLRVRYQPDLPPLACAEADETGSASLRACLLDGARDLPRVSTPDKKPRVFATDLSFGGLPIKALCGVDR
jgi:serine/threonine-protein kinase